MSVYVSAYMQKKKKSYSAVVVSHLQLAWHSAVNNTYYIHTSATRKPVSYECFHMVVNLGHINDQGNICPFLENTKWTFEKEKALSISQHFFSLS